ncbi:McrC family protein [Lactococcus petauri]|uniref:McrC family protein n=1 Tax=Lactococcus petauri TaxID=1940789 RepID=UPI001BCAF4AB|nr:McrC family protein [Lactococcus petauri]MBS4460338.1 McrC family protein [Lactococcus petauri]
MVQKKRTISIREYGRIYADGANVYERDIDELRAYIDEQNSSDHTMIDEFLKPIKNGVQANNYVGVLQTKTGLTIEILPKIAGRTADATDEQIRKLFLAMLKTVRHISGKTFKMTNINTKKNNLLEVFISMFLSESDMVIKRGLKSSYVIVQSNEKFLKGKLLMTQHLRKNTVNQAHFYNEYDEFLNNGPENQLIKTTLEYLLTKSRDNGNLKLIREQLSYFEFVDVTHAPEQTFQKVQNTRNYKYYSQTLDRCRIFLSRKSFTLFKGDSFAFAILFPMEEIFESYIAYMAKKHLPNLDVRAQDKSYSLFDKTAETKTGYRLRPDLVIRDTEKVIIADTKWKVLYYSGPSQADLYQMYAYYTRYHHKLEEVQKVVLIYPYSLAYNENEFRSLIDESDVLGSKIQVRFIDLLRDDVGNQIIKILS